MADTFQPCIKCTRHIRITEATCPFCGAEMPANFGASRPKMSAPSRGPVTRAGILFAGAAVTLACGSTSSIALYGAPIDGGIEDASDLNDGGPMAMYGPAPVDSGVDEATSDASEGGPVAMYGPAIIDGGQG
jgi:hypothetical protein